ncbi:hypothetical protein EJB05_55970, partial [Eragrostis curvula]
MPLEPTPATQSLHPCHNADGVDEMLLVHATRSAAVDPVPVIDRALFFEPRNPPCVEFEHHSAEFKLPGTEKEACSGGGGNVVVVVHRVRFSRASISSLKSMASPPAGARLRQYSTVQCVVAHLWRCITAALSVFPRRRRGFPE